MCECLCLILSKHVYFTPTKPLKRISLVCFSLFHCIWTCVNYNGSSPIDFTCLLILTFRWIFQANVWVSINMKMLCSRIFFTMCVYWFRAQHKTLHYYHYTQKWRSDKTKKNKRFVGDARKKCKTITLFIIIYPFFFLKFLGLGFSFSVEILNAIPIKMKVLSIG